MSIPPLPVGPGVPFITDTGIVLISHIIGCKNCGMAGMAYVNMAVVNKDYTIPQTSCPLCKNNTLRLITYELEEMYNTMTDTQDMEEEEGSEDDY